MSPPSRAAPPPTTRPTSSRDRGGSLDDHHSQTVTPRLIDQADHIIAMTRTTSTSCSTTSPKPRPALGLLHPWGEDVEDPIGSRPRKLQAHRRSHRGIPQRLLDTLGY